MARYSLIVKDFTYITIAQEALKQGKSFGKFVNEILNREAEQIKKGKAGDLPTQAMCIVCGCRASFEMHGKGQQKLFVCSNHKRNFDRFVDSYKNLEI